MRTLDQDFDDEAPTHPNAADLRPRILVVEDNEGLRELIATRMRRNAFDVVEASSGFEALEVLAAAEEGDGEIDLIVMDIQIPGTSGIELARMIRRSLMRTQILLITAFPEPEIVEEAARLRIPLLAKPFPLDRLSGAAIAALQNFP